MHVENPAGINEGSVNTTSFIYNMDNHNAEDNLQSENISM